MPVSRHGISSEKIQALSDKRLTNNQDAQYSDTGTTWLFYSISPY